MPVELFYSYAHEDEALRDELEKHLALLKRGGLIVAWHDRRIGAGREWRDQIDAHARSARIILLLVSPDFIASDYCYNVEMELALARHARSEAIVIPIILRPVDWSTAPFAHLQALPRDAKPVTTWQNRDEAYAQIAQSIRELLVDIGINNKISTSTTDAKRVSQQRVLDAAMPSKIVKDETTELQALIRLPDSQGLKGVLQSDEDAEAKPEDVLSKEFPVTFPRGLDGNTEGITARITLTAPDFEPQTQTKQFIVPPDGDSEVISFLLTALRTGTLKVLVELQWQDALRGARRLLTECVADARAIPVKERTTVVRMPFTMQPIPEVVLPASPPAAYSPEPPSAPPPRPTPSMPSPFSKKKNTSQSKVAWIGASGAIAAALVAGIFTLYSGNYGSPPPVTSPSQPTSVPNIATLRFRIVDQESRNVPNAKVTVESGQSGQRIGYTDSEGYLELAYTKTNDSIHVTVDQDAYERVDRHIAPTVFNDVETIRVTKRPAQPPNLSKARLVWEKNWRTINDPRPTMGSSTSGSWTNKEALLRTLRALDLSPNDPLVRKRQQLITLINQAKTNPKDPTYNLHYTEELRALEDDLKREIRSRAIDHGVDVTIK